MDQRVEIPLHHSRFLPGAHWREAIRWEEPDNRFVTGVEGATLTLHVPEGDGARPVTVVCPGGGYGGVSLDKEGHHIAEWLAERGVVGAVLKYRTPRPGGEGLPLPVADMMAALEAIGRLAGVYGMDPSKVTLMGFSAGGHLAGICGLRHADFALRAGIQAPAPRGLALIYPVVSLEKGFSHGGSRVNLLGENPPAGEVLRYSMEDAVTSASPRLFLVHSDPDQTVPIANSLLLEKRYREEGAAVEFHRYATGAHGFGMAMGQEGEHPGWVAEFARWMGVQA